MIKSKFKILVLIGRCFVLAVGFGALIMSLLFINVIIDDFDTAGLVASLVFSMLAIGFIYIGLDAVKAITIDPEIKILQVSYFGIYSRAISREEITGFAIKPFSNGLGTFKGVLLQTNNQGQFHFSELDYRNYYELEGVMSRVAPLDNTIQTNYFQPVAKVIYAYAGLVVSLIIILKVIEG